MSTAERNVPMARTTIKRDVVRLLGSETVPLAMAM